MSATGTKHGWPERLFAYSDRTGGPDACWPWIGAKDGKGYGNTLSPSGRIGAAHRLVYEYEVGPIPDGLTIDHLCRNTSCVNPGHMEPVTAAENARRASILLVGRCYRGHPIRGLEDVFKVGTKHTCRECRRAYLRAWKAKRRAA